MTEAAARSPVFCIVDPSLKDFVGHHFAYDEAVARGAAAAGFRAVTLAHRNASESIAQAVEITRCFRRDMWGDSALRRMVPGPLGTVANMWRTNRDFLADLREGLRGLAPPPGSVLFAHMVFRNQLAALADFAWDQPAAGPLEIIILLRYQPSFYDNPLCARAFRKLERAAAGGRRPRLASDSARLARDLGRLTRLPIEVMPIPHTAPMEAAAPPRAPDAPIRFASLGNARDEKGFFEILDAIRVLRDAGELEGVEFVLQCNDAAPDVQAAIDRFDSENTQNVTMLRDSLSPEEYNSQLMKSDVVLVPYWREIYEARTSGVFLESVAAGKVVIATRDTWMSDELERYGAGVLVDDRDPASLVAAIRAVRDDYRRLAAQAAAARADCVARHNPDALIRQVMHGPPPNPATGAVRRVAMLFPWGDFQDRRSGASIRCNLLVDKIAPLVQEVRVLRDGPPRGLPPRSVILAGLLAFPLTLPIALIRLARVPRRVPPAIDMVRTGNVTVEAAPPRAAQLVARALFRLPFRLLARRHYGQELILWYFLERHLDPVFKARVNELVAWADVILLEYPFWADIVAQVRRAPGKKLIVTNHDVLAQQITLHPTLRRLVSRLECRGLGLGDHAVCVSDSDRAVFAARGIDAHVIANPVDAARLAVPFPADPRTALRDLYDILLPPGPVCLFVGSLFGPNVEAAERIKGMAAALSRQSVSVTFVIAGACAAPGRGEGWIALGRIDEAALAALYQLAALVLIPLNTGTGSSVKTVEAFAAGKPVLGTSTAFRGLNPRPDDNCSQLDDLDAWPERIVQLLASPGKLAAMGEAAREAGAAFDYHRVFDAYLPLLGIPFPPPDDRPGGGAAFRGDAMARTLLARAFARQKFELAAQLVAASGGTTETSGLVALLTAAMRTERPHDTAAESDIRHALVLLAAAAGHHGLAETFLRQLRDARRDSPEPWSLRELNRALERQDFETALTLLAGPAMVC